MAKLIAKLEHLPWWSRKGKKGKWTKKDNWNKTRKERKNEQRKRRKKKGQIKQKGNRIKSKWNAELDSKSILIYSECENQ